MEQPQDFLPIVQQVQGKTLDASDVNRSVTYSNNNFVELGTIQLWNERGVYVQFFDSAGRPYVVLVRPEYLSFNS